VHGDAWSCDQRQGDRKGVGEDRELPVAGDELGEPGGRRASVEEHRPDVLEVRVRGVRDPALLLGEVGPGRDVGLERQVLDRDGAPVHPPEQTCRSRTMRSLRSVSAVTPNSAASPAALTCPCARSAATMACRRLAAL
jgi:hypothetical protein